MPTKAIKRLISYRRAVMLPLAVAITALLAVFVVGVYWWLGGQIERQLDRIHSSVQRAQALAIKQRSETLAALAEIASRSPDLKSAFRRGDRKELLAAATPLFDTMREHHRVSHFYFIDTQRRVFLRMHSPQTHDDLIGRQTLLAAERTGRPAYGLELGVLGTYTLRAVVPWREAGVVIGYIEMGVDMIESIASLSELTNSEVFVLLDKKMLDRRAFEEGMRVLGRKADWDRYAGFVLAGQTKPAQRELLDAYLGKEGSRSADAKKEGAGHVVRFRSLPLDDAGKRAVGKIVIAYEVTREREELKSLLVRMVAAAVCAWALLLLFFDRLLLRLEDRLALTERDRDRFEESSRKDGLTGLYNHTEFYRFLDRSVGQVPSAPVAVLLFDIDHFKQINDSHGHPVGDDVLRTVARVITESVRPADCVARYGGEEFAVVLPDASARAAAEIAERVRQRIEEAVLTVHGRSVRLTISAGVTSYPDGARDAAGLIADADRALYEAKNEGRNRVCISPGSRHVLH